MGADNVLDDDALSDVVALMRPLRPVSAWWAIALTCSLSIPGAVVLGGFALIARNNCEVGCDTSHWTTLGAVAAVLLALSLLSAIATCLRQATLAHVSWVATLATATVAAVLLAAH